MWNIGVDRVNIIKLREQEEFGESPCSLFPVGMVQRA